MNHRIVLYLILSFFVLIISWEDQQHKAIASFHETVNQDEAIRLRILANSDSMKDQWLKREIRNEVNVRITEWVSDIEDLEEARVVISERLDEIEQVVDNLLVSAGMEQDFTVEFNRVQFPTKLYGNLVYPAGEYEAILITLGEGNGENWWCVLFPPLCFVDFSNSDAVSTDVYEVEDNEKENNEIEVQFFLVNLFTIIKGWFVNS